MAVSNSIEQISISNVCNVNPREGVSERTSAYRTQWLELDSGLNAHGSLGSGSRSSRFSFSFLKRFSVNFLKVRCSVRGHS